MFFINLLFIAIRKLLFYQYCNLNRDIFYSYNNIYKFNDDIIILQNDSSFYSVNDLFCNNNRSETKYYLW